MVGLFNLSTLTARQNLNKTDDQSRITVERLSTGKINNGPAGRKVADFITSVALRNDENSYKAILDSLPRATSVLQTADGAGQQISAITARLKDLSYRATSSGSNVERSALQLEFAKLTEEIDRISTTANFNGTKLLDGTLDTASKLNSDRRLNSITSSLNVGTSVLDGSGIVIGQGSNVNALTVTGIGTTNGVISAFSLVGRGSFSDATNSINANELAALPAAINGSVVVGDIGDDTGNQASSYDLSINLNGQTFSASNVNLNTGGNYTLYLGGNTSTGATVSVTLGAQTFTNDAAETIFRTDLASALNVATGTVAATAPFFTPTVRDTFIADFNAGITSSDITITGNAANAGIFITVGGTSYTTANSASINLTAPANQTVNLYANGEANSGYIKLNLKESQFFDNTNAARNDFRDKILADLTGVRLDYKQAFNIRTSDLGTEFFSNTGTPFTVTVADGSSGDINLVGSLETINVSGVYNKTSGNQDVSLLINGKAYTATAVDLDSATTLAFTNAQTGTTITLNKDATKNTDPISSQANLDDLLKKLKNDLDGITIYQSRQIGSGSLDQFKPGTFDGTQLDGLDGFSFQLTSSSFGIINENDQSSKPTTPAFEGFRVSAETAATDGYVSVVINGETFRTADGFFDGKSTNLRDNLENGKLVLTNDRDTSETFVIDLSKATSTGINIDSDLSARGLEDALNKVFNTTRETKLSFQVGLDVADKISLNIGGLTTDDLFKNADGQTRVLDISTIAGANEAINVLTLANEKVSSALAEITSAFARFENVKESVRTAIKNLSEARDPIENADIAEESSKYAELQVLRDVATAVLTTENQKNRSLSRLIG